MPTLKYLKKFEKDLDYYFSEILEFPYAKPQWIYMSLTHNCTYECKMCSVVRILKEYELPLDTAKKALNEIAAWGRDCEVVITGGEPFLRADIFELFDYGVSKNIKMEVVSNGACIDESLSYKIISSGIQNIAISLDGAQEATHDFVRQKGSFKKAVNAITNLVRAKKKTGGGPQISVWTTIMKENVNELFDVIRLVKDLGVECLVFHPVIVAQDDMQNTSSEAPFWIGEDKLYALKGQIDKIVKYQAKYGLVAFLHDPYLWLKYFEGTLTKQDWKCNPFVFANIGPDGNFRSCGSAFGNIKAAGIESCLHTQQADKARRSMKMCTKPCLQTCWAYPEADSLTQIIKRFILGVRESGLEQKEKRCLIEKGLYVLETYEAILSEKSHVCT